MEQDSYIDQLVREFRRLKGMADKALGQVSDSDFFVELGEDENSLAILVKHMAGNMRSRWRDFLTTDGEKPDRHRDREFLIGDLDTRKSLGMAWEAGWEFLLTALGPLDDEDLSQTVTIRNEPFTVLQAVHRQLTHYAYHVGQIVSLARHHVGMDWQTLSVAKGKSVEFNRSPTSYLETEGK